MDNRSPQVRSARRRRLGPLLALVALAAVVVAGCSDETNDRINDAIDSMQSDFSTQTSELRDDLEREAGQAGARAAAEAVRSGIKLQAERHDRPIRSMTSIRDVTEQLPDQVKVTGVSDTNGDGEDDDGSIQVAVDSHAYCLKLPETGTDTTVNEGAC